MADVLRPVIGANDFKEGSVIVSVDRVGNTTNHRIDPAINFIDGILSVSGILQDRFDDTGVYGGSTKT
jgi:hypothetical protein|tara:strand:- start:359 stop:562 length:204 start_codon:yes stop_codon:yes gene_type:complete